MDAGAVQALVAAVGGVDAACRDREVLLAAVGSAARVRAWLDGEDLRLARLLAAVETRAEQTLAGAARTSVRSAEKLLERAATVETLPALGAGMTAGEVAAGHVDAVTNVLRQAEPHIRDALVAEAAWIARQAATSTPGALARTLAAEVRALQADGGMSVLERQRRACRLRSWVDADGMWCLEGRFDPVTGLRLHQRILTQTQALYAEAVPDDAPSDPLERQGFLPHAGARLAHQGRTRRRGPARADRRPRHHHRHPQTGRGLGAPGRDPLAVLHDLFPTARLHPVIVCNGVVLYAPGNLNLGRATRLASPDQRRVLRALYPTCAIPGCDRRFELCKIHHVIWWEHDGLTDLDNLLPLCVGHHHAVHDRGWQLKLTPGRLLTITYPDGTTHTTSPPRRC